MLNATKAKFNIYPSFFISLGLLKPYSSQFLSKDCWDECSSVDDVIPTVVEEDVCNTVHEPVCNKVDTLVCSDASAAPTQQTCPVIHLKPQAECGHEQSSGKFAVCHVSL